MAVSQLPVLESEASFIQTFASICQATLNLEPCTPPVARSLQKHNDESFSLNNEDAEDDKLLSLVATQCEASTIIQERRFMKLGGTTPYYNDTGKQLLLDQPSKAIWSLS
jgi:hypothetical protein